MKVQTLPFTFSKGEIFTVRIITDHREASIRELSTLMKIPESSVSKNVKSLEIKGIVKTRKEGMKKYVDISDRNYALSLFEMLKTEPYVPWEKLVSNSSIPVLFRISTGEESFEHELSHVSTWRALNNLSMHGMITAEPEGLLIRDRYLSRFISDYSDQVSRKYLMGILPKDAVILWRSGYRCLFRIKSLSDIKPEALPKGTFPTALTVSPEFGIQFITSDSYYYFEPNLIELTLEEKILHTLLIDPESQTYASYALLLAFKVKNDIDMDLLMAKSRKYKLEEKVKIFISYIRSNGRNRKWPLPKVNELREQADLYGMVLN